MMLSDIVLCSRQLASLCVLLILVVSCSKVDSVCLSFPLKKFRCRENVLALKFLRLTMSDFFANVSLLAKINCQKNF